MDCRLFIVALAGLSTSSGLAFARSSKLGTIGDEEKVGRMSLEASDVAINRAKADAKRCRFIAAVEHDGEGALAADAMRMILSRIANSFELSANRGRSER